MADEARVYQVTIPAGTALASPLTVALPMPARTVESVSYHVPNGSQGLMGWQLAMGGVQVLPTAGITWIVGEALRGTFTLEGLPDSGAWQAIGYNLGGYPHSVWLTFHVSVPRRRARQAARWSDLDLAGVPDLSQAGPPVGRPR